MQMKEASHTVAAIFISFSHFSFTSSNIYCPLLHSLIYFAKMLLLYLYKVNNLDQALDHHLQLRPIFQLDLQVTGTILVFVLALCSVRVFKLSY